MVGDTGQTTITLQTAHTAAIMPLNTTAYCKKKIFAGISQKRFEPFLNTETDLHMFRKVFVILAFV